MYDTDPYKCYRNQKPHLNQATKDVFDMVNEPQLIEFIAELVYKYCV